MVCLPDRDGPGHSSIYRDINLERSTIMRVFLTGATGFVGSAIIPELLGTGYRVLGLARSDDGARALIAAGADVHRGDLEDLESLRHGAALADGVIHTAFNHDFSRFAENSEADRRAIEAIGEVLAGSDRPLVVTAGVPPIAGSVTTEEDVPPAGPQGTPRVSEQAAMSLVARGVNVSVVRLPQVHDRDKHGLATFMIALARATRLSAYVGSGLNRWPAVHRLDAAPLYRRALETGAAGARYHAVAEEGVSLRAIAQAIGDGLNVPVVALSPEDAPRHFGWLAFPVGMDAPASAALTRARLAWAPTDRPGFLADLAHSTAFSA